MVDRTTKILLVLIAVALWGILLRPLLAPAPVQAQGQAAASPVGPAVVMDNKSVYVAANGVLTEFSRNQNGNIYSVDSHRYLILPTR